MGAPLFPSHVPAGGVPAGVRKGFTTSITASRPNNTAAPVKIAALNGRPEEAKKTADAAADEDTPAKKQQSIYPSTSRTKPNTAPSS